MEDPVFRTRVRRERMRQKGVDTTLPEPVLAGTATSIFAIKETMGQLVDVDHGFEDLALFEEPADIGVRQPIGFRHDILSVAPSPTLAVGTRYFNQSLFHECSLDFRTVRRLADVTEDDVMADWNGLVRALSQQLASWLRH